MTRAEAIAILNNSLVSAPRNCIDAINTLMENWDERTKGNWISKGCGEYRCSACRRIVDFGDEDEAYLFDFSIKDYKFCPFCGSDMRGGKDD